MSEDTFVLKAHWPSREAALEARPKVEAFFGRLKDAYEAWQSSRTPTFSGDRKAPLYLAGLPGFVKAFPDVIQTLALEGYSDNDFAGELESPYLDPSCELVWENAGVRVMAEVWSATNWDRLCTALKLEFGAETASWREARLG